MKNAVTFFLLAVIVVAIATKIVSLNMPSEPLEIHDGNHIVLCHSEIRCPTCQKMELRIESVLKEHEYADIGLVLLEYDRPQNHEFAERFHVGTLSIILLEQKNGKTVRFSDISGDAKNLIKNDEEFDGMLKTRLNEFYGQTRQQ